MSKYDKLIQQNSAQKQVVKRKTELATFGMDEITTDINKVAAIYNNPATVLKDIDETFMEATKLNRNEVALLMLATALQIARWVIMNQLTSISNAGNDNATEEKLHKLQEKIFKQFDAEGAGIFCVGICRVVWGSVPELCARQRDLARRSSLRRIVFPTALKSALWNRRTSTH